ncbi:J domain-containing protein [Hymenobacter metallicola]|uniref:J domain-containing protein n=1 Tax=Hymenobacter metallicola TaxID=2563114 RepID=A0A4Z0QDQ3_9BACT|nr:J domain-containing protein [Hymenobacter metallicola]TGE27303.1 J domain-containing protein [Hymenobacter metallicola]
MMQTHYRTLGVEEQATPDEIRRAYRKLVLLTHPDRTTDPTAHQQFLLINEAYDVLSNPARRRGYDALLAALRSPARPVVTAPPPPAAARPRPPFTTVKPSRRFRGKPIDFSPYQRPIRLWGKILVLLGLLVFVDYYGFTYTTTAELINTTIYDSGADTYVVRTSKGRFLTWEDPTATTAVFRPGEPLRLDVSLLFRFIRGARSAAGPALPVLFRHQALFFFAGLLLVSAGLTQGRILGDAGRVNAAIFATSFAVLVLMMIRI